MKSMPAPPMARKENLVPERLAPLIVALAKFARPPMPISR
jgi:hypothetical protein